MKKTLITFFLYLFFASGMVKAQTSDPLQILSQMGFMTVYQNPVNFQLRDLDGRPKSLNDFKGKWIWLTFWATWCGPCAYELPILENLHQEFKSQNLVILGISTDQSPSAQVKRYVEQKNLTFPILHDQDSQVGATYQASAIPSIYVISPDFKLVGIFRGANNWEGPHITQSLTQLLAHKVIPAASQRALPAAGDQGNAPLDLPINLIPPEMEILPFKEPPRAGEKIPLEILIKWKGPVENYLLRPPVLTLPAEVEQGEISSFSQSSVDGVQLIYQIPLTFKKEGAFFIGPVELSYRSRMGGKEQFSRIRGMEVTLGTSLTKKILGLFLILILTLLILGGGILLLKKRKMNSLKAPANERKKGAEEFSRGLETLAHIQKIKISGTLREYSVELLKLHLEWQNEETDSPKWKKTLEEIQYGGKDLSTQEMNLLEKNLAKIFSEHSEHIEEKED